jgi:hypothetical protein
MILAIDADKVDQVLLADGVWHGVAGKSFDLGGGQLTGSPSLWATWTDPDGFVVACPVPAVLAVKTKKTDKPEPTRARQTHATAEPARRASSGFGRD